MGAAPYERLMVLDFETVWKSKDDENSPAYTLSKMTTEEYVRDPRFHAYGMSYKWFGEKDTYWVDNLNLPGFLNSIDWSTTAVAAHNAQFDVSILAWHYGKLPCFIYDSLSMARALRGVEVGNSLAKLAEDFGLPPKGKGVHSTDGLGPQLPPHVYTELVDYCKHDTWLAEKVLGTMLVNAYKPCNPFPTKELRLIDMTLKMYVRPLLRLDAHMLTTAIKEERARREGLLERLGVTDSDLASSDKFGELLTTLGVAPPMKESKIKKGKMIPALAKTDAQFQALLIHDNEEVSLLCEARLKVKSTLERTRAQRLLDIATRGALPVPLSYYGAHTGRWAASKGQALNLQNLKRGSFLRRAVMAPDGYVCVVADLSQIEPRVLAWLAGYDALLELFRAGVDVYAAFGAQMFGVPGMTRESHPQLRQSAKSALLGCFGEATPVLTQRGWVPIVQVCSTDLLWDGEEWIPHRGVVAQGQKEVLTAAGISATPDHEILTERGWVAWSEVLTSPFLFQSALSLANLPVSRGSTRQSTNQNATSTATNLGCAVRADGKVLLPEQISEPGEQRAVMPALRRKLARHFARNKVFQWCAQMLCTANGSSTALARPLSAAQTQAVSCIQTMAGAVSRFINRGWTTELSFFGTLSACPGGITRHYSSTVSTTNEATNPATCAFAHEAKTWPTNGVSRSEKSKPCAQKMQTYDIAYAGPRNRYTILSEHGPLIVHNCGFQLGWLNFATQLIPGFLGAPPTLYDMAFAKQLGVRKEDIQRFIDYPAKNGKPSYLEQALAIPRACSDEQIIVHCIAAQAIINKYRSAAEPVVNFWSFCQESIESSLIEGGREFDYKCLRFEPGHIFLPNGMALRYPDLKFSRDGGWSYQQGDQRKKLYGGRLTENIVQAVARLVMTDGMLRIQKRYPVVLTVHDEAVCLVPESEAEEAEKWVLEQMTMEPKYMPGIPLAADAGSAQRYGDAK